MTYKLTKNPDSVLRLTDNATIPRSHRDWAVYEEWLAVGNTPLPAYTLDNLKDQKITELDAAVKAAIYAGFTSTALGAPYTYSCDDRDQQNLAAVVTASLVNAAVPDWTINFWCADGAGVWARRAHTAAQIQQVGNAGLAHVQGHLEHRAQLVAQIADATTEAAVAAIVW